MAADEHNPPPTDSELEAMDSQESVSSPDFDPSLPLRRDKWEAFCCYYLNHHNATRAFVEAGYSRNGAGQNSYRLMSNNEVLARIDYLRKQRAERLSIRADKVLEEAAILAHSDMDDYEYLGNGKVDVRKFVDPKLRRAISKVKFKKRSWYDKQLGEVVTEEEVELGLWDKPKSVEQLGKHLGLFPVQVKVEDPDKVIAETLGVDVKDLPE
jgi:phage terminase small subunit